MELLKIEPRNLTAANFAGAPATRAAATAHETRHRRRERGRGQEGTSHLDRLGHGCVR